MPNRVLTGTALRLLACPVCHSALVLLSGSDQIACMGCGRHYPMRDGLPVLLPDAAHPTA